MLEWLVAQWDQILGFATGAACVFLAGRRSVWNFPVGIANTVVFLVLFAATGLYASSGLQVVYLAMGAHGWWRWTRRVEQHRDYVVRTPRHAVAVLVVAAVVAFAVLVWLLTSFTDSQVPLADAGTTAASLVAQYMLNRKWIETWFVWIGVDVAFATLTAATGLWIVAVLYALFVGLCIAALRHWRSGLVADRTPGIAAAA